MNLKKQNEYMKLSNLSILTIAIWYVGGKDHFVDKDDAFEECWKLAPERFSWRTKNYPDIDSLQRLFRKLINEKGPDGTLLLVRTGLYKVRLSASGLQWIARHQHLLKPLLKNKSQGFIFKTNNLTGRVTDFRQSEVFKEYISSHQIPEEKWMLGDALRISASSPSSVWNSRIQSLRADAQRFDDSDVKDFLDLILEIKKSWFKEGQL